MQNINLKIQKMNLSFRKIIEESNLPIGFIYYLLKSLLHEIQNTYYASLNSLILKQQKQQEEISEESQGQAN